MSLHRWGFYYPQLRPMIVKKINEQTFTTVQKLTLTQVSILEQ